MSQTPPSSNARLTSFVEFLSREFSRRKMMNPRFSLRGFARFLDLDPSFLSKVMRGPRRATPLLVERIARRLNLSERERQYFMSSLSRRPERIPLEQAHAFHPLSADEFETISGWQHYALLELVSLEG